MLSKIFSPRAKNPALSARHRLAVRVSRVASMLTVVALVATTLVMISAGLVSTVAPAAATSGNAGTPQAPVSLFIEDFDNFPSATNGNGSSSIQLNHYTGASGATYTAYAGWLDATMCNGAVVSWNNVTNFMNACPSGGGVAGLVYALAGVAGKTGAAALDNHGVAAYTTGNTMPANSVEFETVNDITIPAQSGRFITFSVDAAEYSCSSAHARMDFFLLNNSANPATATKVSANPIDPCTTSQRQFDNPNQSGQVAAARFYGDAPMLFTGSSLGIRMQNQEGTSAGNDAAFDNIQIQDVTPLLDQAFSPASVTMGTSSRMVYTVTNTTDLAAKTPFSFSANLPSGVTIASVPNISSSCGGSLSATANSSSLAFSGGGLTAGQTSCTVEVDVTPSAIGTYTSTSSNVQTTALNQPGSTTLTVTAPPVAVITTTKILENILGANARAADSSSVVRSGDVLQYMFNIYNSGGAGGSTTITDVVPANTTMLSTDWSCASGSVAGTSCSQTVNLAADSGTHRAFVVRVNETIPAGATEIKNVGTSSSCSATSCSPDANPLDTAVVSSVKSLYSVNGVAATASTPVKGGDVLVYQIILTNSGGSGTTTTLSDVVPAATHYSGSGEGWSCPVNSPPGTDCSTTITVPSIGLPTRLTYTVTVATPVAVGVTQIKNTATGASCSASNCSPAANPMLAFRVKKTSDVSAVKAGGAIVYTIAVTNTGGSAYTASTPASVSDSLTGVLDDAVLGSTHTGLTLTGSTLSWAGALAVAQTLTFTYTLTAKALDPGDHVLVNSLVTPIDGNCAAGSTDADCSVVALVQSFAASKTVSTTATKAGTSVTYTISVVNNGLVVYTSGSPARFTDDLSDVLDDATLTSNSSPGVTMTGSVLSWQGALPLNGTTIIQFTVLITSGGTGNKMLGNTAVTPTEGGCSLAQANPLCTVATRVQSFTTVKTASVSTVKAGSTVIYTIVVRNNGQVAYTSGDPAQFTDNLSAVLDDATVTVNAATGVTYTQPTISWQGALAIGATATITYSATALNPGTGNKILTNRVLTPADGNCGAASTDPQCTSIVPVQALSVVKAASAATVKAGSSVNFTITVKNTGQVAYTTSSPATFTDNLAAVLDDATVSVPSAAGASYSAPTLSWQGALAIGATATISYTATATNPSSGNHLLSNTVVSPPEGTCATGSPNALCAVVVGVQTYSVVKTANRVVGKANNTVIYTLAVKNTGSVNYTTGAPATLSDSLADILDDATLLDHAGLTLTGQTLSWAGALNAGATHTFSYTVLVKNPAAAGDQLLTNTVVTPVESTCPASSTSALCTVVMPVQALSAVKTSSAVSVKGGESTTFTIVILNTGQTEYTTSSPASFTDDLSGVLDDATISVPPAHGVSYTAPTLSWSGALAIGATATVSYVATAISSGTGDHLMSNTVVTPSEGTCAATSTNAACTVIVPVQTYSTVKTVDTTTVKAGGNVHYTVVVTNTGTVAYAADAPATFVDDLSAVLDDAVYNNDATDDVAVDDAVADTNFTYAAPRLSWHGELPVGSSTTITYSVTVNNPDVGDHTLTNAIVTPAEGGCGAEKEAALEGAEDPCVATSLVQSFATVKAANVSTVKVGAVVTYTVTVRNTGTVDYTEAQPASFTDDLVEVLDDGDYNRDATNGARFADSVLSWSGALPVGARITIVYSVTAHSPDFGNHAMMNTVFTPTEGGCAVPKIATAAAVCRTSTRVIDNLPRVAA